MQCNDPSMSGQPRGSSTWSRRWMSCALGWRRYSSPKNLHSAVEKRVKHLSAMLSPIRTYSSTQSADIPYDIRRIAAVIFWIEDSPSLPKASHLLRKSITSDIQASSVRIQSTYSQVLGVAENMSRVVSQHVQYRGREAIDGGNGDSGTLGSRQKNRASYVVTIYIGASIWSRTDES